MKSLVLSTEYSLFVSGFRMPAKYFDNSYVAVPMLEITGRRGSSSAAFDLSTGVRGTLSSEAFDPFQSLCTFARPNYKPGREDDG